MAARTSAGERLRRTGRYRITVDLSLDAPDTRSALAKYGATARPQSQADFVRFINAERARVADLVKRGGIDIEQ